MLGGGGVSMSHSVRGGSPVRTADSARNLVHARSLAHASPTFVTRENIARPGAPWLKTITVHPPISAAVRGGCVRCATSPDPSRPSLLRRFGLRDQEGGRGRVVTVLGAQGGFSEGDHPLDPFETLAPTSLRPQGSEGGRVGGWSRFLVPRVAFQRVITLLIPEGDARYERASRRVR